MLGHLHCGVEFSVINSIGSGLYDGSTVTSSHGFDGILKSFVVVTPPSVGDDGFGLVSAFWYVVGGVSASRTGILAVSGVGTLDASISGISPGSWNDVPSFVRLSLNFTFLNTEGAIVSASPCECIFLMTMYELPKEELGGEICRICIVQRRTPRELNSEK